MKLVQYNEYLVSTVDTDGLVFQHLGISSHSAECAPCVSSFLCIKGRTLIETGAHCAKLIVWRKH